MECKYYQRTDCSINWSAQIGMHVRKLRSHGYEITNLIINSPDWIKCFNRVDDKCELKYKTITKRINDEKITLLTTYYDQKGQVKTQQTTGRNKLYSHKNYKEYKFDEDMLAQANRLLDKKEIKVNLNPYCPEKNRQQGLFNYE